MVAAQPVVLAQGEELPRRHQPAVVLPAQVRGQLLPVPEPVRELPRVEAQVWLLVAARVQAQAQVRAREDFARTRHHMPTMRPVCCG